MTTGTEDHLFLEPLTRSRLVTNILPIIVVRSSIFHAIFATAADRFEDVYDIILFNGPTPVSFCLFPFFSAITSPKICRLQRDLNPDHITRRQTRWPLDPGATYVNDLLYVKVYVQSTPRLNYFINVILSGIHGAVNPFITYFKWLTSKQTEIDKQIQESNTSVFDLLLINICLTGHPIDTTICVWLVENDQKIEMRWYPAKI